MKEDAESGFGTIRNNTALKLAASMPCQGWGFWNHSKQHSSKTHDAVSFIRRWVLEPFETTQL